MDNKKKSDYVAVTYPYERPGPKTADPKLNVQHTIKQFNYATPSIKGLNPIPWRDVRGIAISSGGSANGAILIQTVEGNLAVKGSTNPALEYFTNLVYKDLKIRTPNMRVLQYSENEFKIAVDAIQKASYADATQKYKIRQVIDRPFLLLMEYIPAQKIHELGEKRSRMCFEPAYPEGRDRLIRLGILYATDTLFNIRDRYPLIWGNPGNPENVLIEFETTWINKTEELFDKEHINLQMSTLCAIDNRPLLLSKKTNLSQEAYELYLQEFERIVRYVFEGLKPVKDGLLNPFDSTTKRFDYVSLGSTFIYNHTSTDVKSLGEMQILLGLVIGYVNIHNMGFIRIEKNKTRAFDVLKTDWKDLWKDDCENIRLEIIKDELRIIEKYINHNEEVISWVNTITLNNYFIKYEELKDIEFNDSIELQETTDEGETNNNPDHYDEWLDSKLHQHFGISGPPANLNNSLTQKTTKKADQRSKSPKRKKSDGKRSQNESPVPDHKEDLRDSQMSPNLKSSDKIKKDSRKSSRNASPIPDHKEDLRDSQMSPNLKTADKNKKDSRKSSRNASPVHDVKPEKKEEVQATQNVPAEKKKKKGWFG